MQNGEKKTATRLSRGNLVGMSEMAPLDAAHDEKDSTTVLDKDWQCTRV